MPAIKNDVLFFYWQIAFHTIMSVISLSVNDDTVKILPIYKLTSYANSHLAGIVNVSFHVKVTQLGSN